MKYIGFYPYGESVNAYVPNLRQAIELACPDVVFTNAGSVCGLFFRFGNFLRTKYILLNWFESIYARNRFVFYRKYAVKRFLLWWFGIFGKRIVWIVHNRLPHESFDLRCNRKLMCDLMKRSYRVVILSENSREVLRELADSREWSMKVVRMPHPAYHMGEPSVPERDGRLKLLFFGSVAPYKHIELLLEVFVSLGLPDAVLTIAGKPASPAYAQALEALAADKPGIELKLDYLSDEALEEAIKRHDAVVMPYRMEHLNSGAMILAFCCGRTLIGTRIATVDELEDPEQTYSYRYANETEHRERLREAIGRAYADFVRDPAILREKGEALRLEMLRKNNPEMIVEIWKTLLV